jgi:hypothetical protein
MPWYSFLVPIGRFLKRALGFVQTYATEENIELALGWVRVAANKFSDNAARREFVVSILINRGLPENVARMLVEIAVGMLKAEKKAEEPTS